MGHVAVLGWDALREAAGYLADVLPYLLVGVVLAAAAEALAPSVRLGGLFRRGWIPVLVASAAGALTPFCSCTTVGLLAPALAAGASWGPMLAWLVASPISDPRTFALIAPVLGVRLALAQAGSALVLGLAAGLAGLALERRGWLPRPASGAPGRGSSAATADARTAAVPAVTARFARALVPLARRVLRYALAFALVAGVLRAAVPAGWLESLLGRGRRWAVPAAAVIGVPLYLQAAAAVPLVHALRSLGLSEGAALAFLITGPGISAPALGAVAALCGRRVLLLYLAIVLGGAVALGYGLDAVLP